MGDRGDVVIVTFPEEGREGKQQKRVRSGMIIFLPRCHNKNAIGPAAQAVIESREVRGQIHRGIRGTWV